MKQANELKGSLVLIHPELSNDPAKMPNQIGIVTGLEMERDNVWVGFGDNRHALYGMDAVLTLKSAPELMKELAANKATMDGNDYKALHKIALLAEREQTPARQYAALQIAQQNEAVRKITTVSVDKALGIEMGQDIFANRQNEGSKNLSTVTVDEVLEMDHNALMER
jgi:hypothetical protein